MDVLGLPASVSWWLWLELCCIFTGVLRFQAHEHTHSACVIIEYVGEDGLKPAMVPVMWSDKRICTPVGQT